MEEVHRIKPQTDAWKYMHAVMELWGWGIINYQREEVCQSNEARNVKSVS